MGQQQLLLLVLGIVIVGLAVVVGINAFSENRIKSNADAMVTDGLRIASDIQAYVLKPTQFGGGNDGDATSDDLGTFGALTSPLSAIGYADPYTNVNGSFSVGTCTTAPSTDSYDVQTGVAAAIFLVATSQDTGNEVCIAIAGTGSANIGTNVTYGNAAPSGT